MPAGVISVGVMADFLSVIEQSDQAGLSVEAFSGKVVTSTRDASRAWADYAKNAKLSADVAASAAAKVAAAADAAFGSLDANAKAQGAAAMQAARATGASADEQSAAYARAATAARDAQVIQKAASDAQIINAEKAAAATKAMADAQAEAAAKVDLLSGHLSGLGERTAGVAREISKLGGIGFAASIAGTGDLAAKYQQATESIAANSGTTSAAAAKIGTAFLGTSGKTIYSAKDLTAAFATVAGQLKSTEGEALNAGQALKVMSAAGDLAEATNTDLTSSTGALSMVMQGYHLSVGEAAQASDLLFNTSRALNQPLGTVAQAINRLHGRLGDLAPSLGDVGGLMVELGSHGVQGSRGVSVVNTAFQTLIGQSEPVTKMLNALGVNVFNSQGKFVGLQSVIAQLQPKFSQLTQQSQDLAAKTLFGSSAAQVMLATVQRGPDAFAKSTAAAAQLGTAHQAATDQSKTLGKQLDILKASVENDATSIGLKLLPSLIAMTHGLEDGVTWLEKHKAAAEALGITIGTVLAGAVTVFAYQKSKAFVSGLSDMAHGATSLASGVGNAYSSIANSLGGITNDAAATTSAVDGTNATMATSNATTGASFATTATEADTAGATLDSEWAASGAKVVATDDAIKTANAETAASFDAILTKLGPLTVAFAAYEAIKATPGVGNILGDGNGPKNSLPMPTTGETERKYLSQNLGIPGYKGPLTAAGVEHARTQSGYPAENALIQQVFKQLDAAGHFGKHGFAPSTQGSGGSLPLPGVKGSATTANPAQLVNYMQKALGLTKNQAAGIAGNIEEESAGSFAGNIVQGGGRSSTIVPNTGYGLAQWTDSGRQGNLAALAKQMGLPQDSVKVQEAFIVQELKGSYSNALKNLRGTSTAAQAATVIQNEYEGPASLTASLAERQRYAEALAGGKTVTPTGGGSTAGTTGSKSLNAAVLNIGSGGALPAVMQASSATSQATQLSDQANKAQAVGQATVTWLQAINQQLQDKGAATVQNLTNIQTKATDHSAALVTAMKDQTQRATDRAAENVTVMKNQQAIDVQHSAIQVAKIAEATTAINDASAINVATINAAATKVSDADNAAATLTTDNAQTNADTISEKGLYGLNLVTQQLQVQADIIKAGFDQQIATAQAMLDSDQGLANIANATAQQTTDQVTATQTLLELTAQQKVNTVTQTQDALEAKAQQHLDSVTLSQDAKEAKAQYHLDSVTLKEDAIANAAKAHVDAVTVSQDQRILKATQHADNVQLSVDVTKIGPAQTWADMQAGASKTAQTQAQNALNLATAQGSVTTNAANAALATVTASANTSIAQAQNQYQTDQNAANTAIQVATDQYQQSQNAANMAIQKATGQYQASQNRANSAIQAATDNYQTVQDNANYAIAQAAKAQAMAATNWANQLAADQAALSGIQGGAAAGEASAQGSVTGEQALASTQFAGSGLMVNIYGADLSNPAAIEDSLSWAIRSSSVATG